MRILVTGKQGQIVCALKRVASDFGIDLLTLGRPEADLANPKSLREPITAISPDVIISAAAYTQVDNAESEPELATAVNGIAPGVLARTAAELRIPIIHLSTDYVFDGQKLTPYVETDATQPLNVYGRTKLAGERVVVSETPNHVILRTTWVYSPFGTNFVKSMLRLSHTEAQVNVVADQFGAPTAALEIARAMLIVAQRLRQDASSNLRGLFHLSAQGETSWAGFAQTIFAELETRGGKGVKVTPIPSSAYPTAATRPANSRLNCEKFFSVYGLRLEPWRVSLQTCLNELIGQGQSES